MLTCRRRPDPRAALVTGASSGIGAAIARALPPSTTLVLTGRDTAALEALANELATPEREVRTVPADLASSEGRAAVVAAGEAAEIDLLVNNAGLGTFGPFLDAEPAKLEATLEVNVLAVAGLCRALLPGMLTRAHASGRRAGLVNLASTAAFAPVPRLATYAASKAFVLSLTEALTAELAREPIDILAFCPGPVRTPFGSRAGYSGSTLPGAISTSSAARRLLAALGHRHTAFTDLPSEALLAPLARARTTAAAALVATLGLAGMIDGLRRRAG